VVYELAENGEEHGVATLVILESGALGDVSKDVADESGIGALSCVSNVVCEVCICHSVVSVHYLSPVLSLEVIVGPIERSLEVFKFGPLAEFGLLET